MCLKAPKISNFTAFIYGLQFTALLLQYFTNICKFTKLAALIYGVIFAFCKFTAAIFTAVYLHL